MSSRMHSICKLPKKEGKKLIRGTVYLPNCHDSQCSEAYAVWCSVPVHCAANERDTR